MRATSLEGVSLDAKNSAIKAASEAGMSVHAWLDLVVRQAAQSDTTKQMIPFPMENQSEVA